MYKQKPQSSALPCQLALQDFVVVGMVQQWFYEWWLEQWSRWSGVGRITLCTGNLVIGNWSLWSNSPAVNLFQYSYSMRPVMHGWKCRLYLASFPGLPRVFSVYIQYNTQKWKSGEKWGRPGNPIMWMTSGGHGRRGAVPIYKLMCDKR